MDKYIGITISYTGIPITVNVRDVSTRFCNNAPSYRLIIREETLVEDVLKMYDIIAVRRHNSYEWAIITSIMPEATEIATCLPVSGKVIKYGVLERTGRISAICLNGGRPRGLYTIVSQDKIINNNYMEMEAREVSITLEQAREWYKGDNAALKAIALNAFKDWELEEKFEDVVRELDYMSMCRMVPIDDVELIGALINLRKLAKALNGDWVRRPKEKAWFFSGAKTAGGCIELENLYHIEADYPTVTYFKDLRTLNRAKEIILKEWDKFKALYI